MVAFLTLLKNDIKLFFKDWKAVILILVMPFLFICLFVYALSPYLNKSNFVEPFSIALVDKEDTVQTRILVNQLDEIQIFKEIKKIDEAKAQELISQNQIAAAVIIPEGFSDSVVNGENKPVTVIGNKAMPLQSYIVRNLIQSAANLVSAGQSAINAIYYYDEKAGLTGRELEKDFSDSTMKLFLDVLARNEIYSQAEGSSNLDLTPAEYFTSALLVIFLMFAGMPAMKMIVTERSLSITGRLAVSPVKGWQIILSKFLVSLILSVLQFSLVITLTSLIFKNYWGAPLKNILLIFAGTVIAVSAWSIFVSAVSRTPASADVIGNLGILLMAILGGSIYPLSSMPEFVRGLSRLTINRWAMDGFMVIFSGNDALGVTNFVFALCIISFVFLALSVAGLKLVRKNN